MAVVVFYDSTELDKQQLSEAFSGTDHHLEFVDTKLDESNCNPEAEVISVFVTSQVTRQVIEALPKLKLIACRSTGFNNIDLVAAEEHGVTVTNVPTYGEATVAEYAFGLLLVLQRKLLDVLTLNKGQFSSEDLTGHDLEGKVFGVIGTGHIGQKALKIANGFSMQTIAYDVIKKEELQDELHFKYVELDELLSQADIVSLHVPLLPATQHIMNRDNLGKMKSGAILINTARGELVDTNALVEFIDNGHLGGAAIDVVEGEALLNYNEEMALLRSDSLPEEVLRYGLEISALEKMPNVIISPHNAFNTIEAIKRINDTTAKNIIDYWYGNIPNQIKPDELDKKSQGKLLIMRHAESEWNVVGKWTGTRDVHLSEKGFRESAMFGEALKKLDIHIDKAYCSEQVRARETLECMLDTAHQLNVDTEVSSGINERDYGDYTGKNKWDMKELIGQEAFDNVRRGWDVEVPNGETLKMVYERAMPFYKEKVLPELLDGKNVLIVAHGNSIRALKKYIESIRDEDISQLEMAFGQIDIYDVTPDGHKANYRVEKIDTTPPNA